MAYKNMSYAEAKKEAKVSQPNSFNIKTVQEKDFPSSDQIIPQKEKMEDRIIPGSSSKWDSNEKINNTKDIRMEQNYLSREDQHKNQKKPNKANEEEEELLQELIELIKETNLEEAIIRRIRSLKKIQDIKIINSYSKDRI